MSTSTLSNSEATEANEEDTMAESSMDHAPFKLKNPKRHFAELAQRARETATDSESSPPKKSRPAKKPPLYTAKESVEYTGSTISFVVEGKPRPKPRAGSSPSGRRYNPSAAAEKDFAAAITTALQHESFSKFKAGSLLSAEMEFLFPPNSNPSPRSICNTADVDNLIKFVLDALNDILYDDDRQFIEVRGRKGYDTQHGTLGRITVTISEATL